MKKFNELTSVEKYKRIKNKGIFFKASKWISIVSPYLVIGIVNFNDYFTEANGVKMSMGCTLALIVAGIAIKNETSETKKINNLVVWGVAFALCYLLSSVLQDLLLIVGCGLLGQIVGAGFDIGYEKENEKAKLYRESIIKAEAMGENMKLKLENKEENV